ncbi:MAG: FAD-binding oxidoreductase [Candidatus Kapaibacterium sp.]
MIFFPASNDDASQFLRQRSKGSLHISGTGQDRNDAEIISVAKLNSVLFYEPEEMIISVQTGISLEGLQNTLAAKGQWIPTLVVSESSEQTLGAAIASDHFHPRSLTCGALRTTILGGTFCTTTGEIFKSGSRVVKSVAGYDIHRAFCGSKGLFGIILDLTLKVQPLPEIFYRFFASPKEKERLAQFHPTCLQEYPGKLLVEFAGYREDIENDIDSMKSFEIDIELLDERSWIDALRKLIFLHDEKRENNPSPEVEKLLQQVRHVFDPEGVLV